MSVSNKNTDNQNSLLQMPPQSPMEENKKWRCTKLSNGGNNSQALSPDMKYSGDDIRRRLGENEEINHKTCTTKISPSHPRRYRSIFVRLAEESPKRNSAEYSDSSTYDSLNCRETDICHDSSDTDSNSSCSSERIRTIKVVEYEVASTSNSEDLFTNDSSSGTDDMFIAVASVLCQSPELSSNFADTEEESSDTVSNHDPEMSSADYWMCVKCKNENNNPMFRYCEKCYQIRKTHFPPRPRLRKSRSALKQRKLFGFSSLQRAATTSLIEQSMGRRRRNGSEKKKLRHNSLSPPSSPSLQKDPLYSIGRLVGISQKQLRNCGESSSDDDDTTSKFYKCINNTSSKHFIKGTQTGSHTSNLPAIAIDRSNQGLQICTKRKLSVDSQSTEKSISKKFCYEKDTISPLLASETENETDFALSQSLCGGSTQSTQKDSGFSSAPSSQDRKSSSDHPNEEDEDLTSHPSIRDDVSDTVTDELNDSDVAEILHEDKYTSVDEDTCLQLKTSNKTSGSLLTHTPIRNTELPLLQSISDYSDTYSSIASPSNHKSLRTSPSKQADKVGENQGDITSYGSCMTCLVEPKNGVFVHSRFLHLCCCYKCAMKIWNKNKKCPICNCAVKNVMKLFVH